MKVSYISYSLPSNSTGGPARVVHTIISELIKNDEANIELLTVFGRFHDEKIKKLFDRIALQNDQGKGINRKDIILENYMDFFRAFMGIGLNGLANFRLNLFSSMLAKALIKSNQRVIHNHVNVGLPTQIVDTSCPIITTFHTKGPFYKEIERNKTSKRKLLDYLREWEMRIIRDSRIITFPSLSARNMMLDEYGSLFGNKDIRIIYNGVDTRLLKGVKNNRNFSGSAIKIVNVAQHVSEKRFEFLLEIIHKAKKYVDVIVHNIGSGPLTTKYISIIKELGLEKNIVFHGNLNHTEVLKIMQHSDIYLLPSVNVVFDLATLEALGSGIPVIVSDDGGNKECIENNITGVLLQPSDLNSWVDLLRDFKNNSSYYYELSDRAIEKCESEFSFSSMLSGYKKLYQELGSE